MLKDNIKLLFEEKEIYANILTPKNNNFGDFAININQLQKKDINIQDLKLNIFEKVEKKDSFINFYINDSTLINNLSNQDFNFENKNKTILVEFGQPNTHKTPHIGHLFSYIFGESISRILEINGYKVIRLNYQGDVGPHVAKCLWYIKQNLAEKNKLDSIKDKINFLQKAYQEGSRAFEENTRNKEEIIEINKAIYNKDPSVLELWKETRDWSLEYDQKFEKELGITYEKYYFESQTFEIGKKIVEENVGKIFEESDGAIIFKGEDYGLHTRVFINNQNIPTYEGKDIGLISLKNKDFKYDLSIVTTASEQTPYWKVVKKAAELIYPKIGEKILHLGFGMINLKSGKMSSRDGVIFTAFELIDRINEIISNSFETSAQNTKKIGLSAVKYSFLKSDYKKNITFDIDESVSVQGNSGPYIQYTYARCNSITTKKIPQEEFAKTNLLEEEKSILRHLIHFDEAIQNACLNYSPHLISNFIFELCQKYNYFYEKCAILNEKDIDKMNLRLKITQKVANVIKIGLNLLGIEIVEKI